MAIHRRNNRVHSALFLVHCSLCVSCRSGIDSDSCQPGALGPIPGSTCSSIVTSSSSNCPAGPANSYPGAGSAAIAMLVIVSLLLLLRLFLYCVSSTWTPRLGARLRTGMIVVQDYTRGSRQAAPLLLAGASLILKLTALGVDRWDVLDLTDPDGYVQNLPSVYWSEHARAHTHTRARARIKAGDQHNRALE